LVRFVNGHLPVVIELKKPGVPVRAAFDENLTHNKRQNPASENPIDAGVFLTYSRVGAVLMQVFFAQ